jgi:hypothetical protein
VQVLEKSLFAAFDCKENIKKFRSCDANCGGDSCARIFALIQKLALPLRSCCSARECAVEASASNRGIAGNHPSCISLIVRGAHGSPDQRGLKTRGGRANRRRCARKRRFPSVRWVVTHSNMSTVVLCQNFSGEALVSRSLRTREIGTGYGVLPSGGTRSLRIEGKTGFIRLNDFECQALRQRIGTVWTDSLLASNRGEGGGCMLYKFIAVNDRISFSNDTLIIFSRAANARPRSRAPDTPLSTR